jgi:predicted N-acetyltransferase YhbS
VALTRDPSWIWIAASDCMPAGMLRVSPPEHASWIAPMVDRSPVAYLSCLAVDAQERGTGIGSGLVAVAHAALDAAGVAATLLHYAALNPLSGPFWHRHGYRPLWTIWQTKPASWLR